MAIDPAVAALAGAVVSLAGAFYAFIRIVLKRSWDREDKLDIQLDRLADLIEQALAKLEQR